MFDRASISNGLRHLRNVCCRADSKSLQSPDDQSESGAALVEFTILMPVFFLILFGIIEFGAMIWVQNTMTNAAREGARTASVQNGTMTAATQKACNRLALSSAGQTFAIVATDTCDLVTQVGEVNVVVTVSKASASLFNTLFTFSNSTLGATTPWAGNIGSGATMRREGICTAAQAAVTCNCGTAGGNPSGC